MGLNHCISKYTIRYNHIKKCLKSITWGFLLSLMSNLSRITSSYTLHPVTSSYTRDVTCENKESHLTKTFFLVY